MKSRKSDRKMPNVPMKVQISTQVGVEHVPTSTAGSRDAEPPTMMTKRSNHMPAFTNMQTK